MNAQSKLYKAQRQLGALVYSLAKGNEENQPLVDKYIEMIANIEQELSDLKASLEPDTVIETTFEDTEEAAADVTADAAVEPAEEKPEDNEAIFKRFTAEGFYHVMNALGADIVFNHADYRLISTRVLESFADYREVNIFLRGMVPLVGYPSDTVYYERHERLAGESHYPLSKMLALAFDGITSLSNKPIRLITGAGIVVSLISFIGVIWASGRGSWLCT